MVWHVSKRRSLLGHLISPSFNGSHFTWIGYCVNWTHNVWLTGCAVYFFLDNISAFKLVYQYNYQNVQSAYTIKSKTQTLCWKKLMNKSKAVDIWQNVENTFIFGPLHHSSCEEQALKPQQINGFETANDDISVY